MLKEDKDIEKIKDDKLNRKNFANNLAKNIKNYFKKSNNCLTIGLIGEWGAGKTSLLNMTQHYLKDSKIKIIEFNPWLYSSYNQLVEQFFDELIKGFADDRDSTLRKYLNEYKLKINKLNLLKNIAVFGASSIKSNLGNFAERTLKLDSEEKNLKNIKTNINRQLMGRKVVCIIDDLDRLPKNEIAEMFKLIKIMADFKNIIYLVAFDKEFVANALGNDYGGEKYIEKIINVPLHIPSIDYIELKDCLIEHFRRISREYEKDLDLKRLNQFLDFKPDQHERKCGILYFFKNMRDITRFINILEFNLELIINEVNLVDFIVITAIQVFHSEIYDKIKYNEFLLINYHYINIEEFNDKIIENERTEFEKLMNNNENLNHILRILFPKMRNPYIEYPPLEFRNYDYADTNLLICHPNHFKAYFKLNSIIKELTEHETNFVVEYINSENKPALTMEFTRLYKENKLRIFLKNIKNRLYKIHKNKFFLNFLFKIETNMWEDIFFANRDEIEELCLEMIYQIGDRDRFDILKEAYQDSNNIILLFDLLDSVKIHSKDSMLTDKELIKLTEIIKEKFNSLRTNNFFVENKLSEVLYIGGELNLKSKNDSIIDELISTSNGLLILLQAYLPLRENSSHLLIKIGELNEQKNVDEIKQLVDNDETIKDEFVVKIFLDSYDKYNNQINS